MPVHPISGALSCVNILIKVTVGLEALHQDLHLLHLPEGQVGDDAQQPLQHAQVRAHKGAVDLVQQHHQLVLVPREEEVALWRKSSRIYMQESIYKKILTVGAGG